MIILEVPPPQFFCWYIFFVMTSDGVSAVCQPAWNCVLSRDRARCCFSIAQALL